MSSKVLVGPDPSDFRALLPGMNVVQAQSKKWAFTLAIDDAWHFATLRVAAVSILMVILCAKNQ